MKNCTNCTHADWKKTAAGKLHPSGYGKCTNADFSSKFTGKISSKTPKITISCKDKDFSVTVKTILMQMLK